MALFATIAAKSSRSQLAGAILMAVWLDLKVGVVLVEEAPRGSASPGGAPDGLIDIQRVRTTR